MSPPTPSRAAANDNQPAISTHGLTIRYGRQTAVDGVSFEVEPGAVYALLGRNGAGKTSTVRCLLGQQRPASGRVSLLGADSWNERASLMAECGVVPEKPDAPPTLSASRLGRFCARLYPRWDSDGYRRRLERFGVSEGTPFGKLSRGQQTLVQLALALAPSPRLLVLDDPTLGLDAVARRAFFEELAEEMHELGAAVLLASHDLEGISRIADRVGILHEGRLAIDEELETLKARFRSIRYQEKAAAGAEAGLGALEPVLKKTGTWGVETVVSRYDDLAASRMHDAGPLEVSSMSLEEIFIAITGNSEGGEG